MLVPASMLLRRADAVAVIGAGSAGEGERSGTPPDRCSAGPAGEHGVRGWLRRFARRAQDVRVLFTGLLHALDPAAVSVTPTGSVPADALEVLGLAAAAAARLFGPRPAWHFSAAASGGLLLGPADRVNGADRAGVAGKHELTLGSRPQPRQPSSLPITA